MSDALRVLLGGAIDYAGLFPPAGLDMATAAANYAEYRRGAEAWALGRFVVPAARLEELEQEAASVLRPDMHGPWRLSALVSDDRTTDAARIADFNRRRSADAVVDTVELRASTTAEIAAARRLLPESMTMFVEIPLGDALPLRVAAVRDAGVMAKVRTGGVTAAAFPAVGALARFISLCADERVPFKATAGLHHALRATYPLTYQPDSARGTMYGFLNVLLGAAIARLGADERDLIAALEERSPDALRVDRGGVEWRGRRLDVEALAETRAGVLRSFGSCSFREPLEDLGAMSLV